MKRNRRRRSRAKKPLKRTTIQPLDELLRRFPDQESARAYLEAIRWPEGPRCPYCTKDEGIGKRKGDHYRCNACREDFTVRTGTVMDGLDIPLQKWLYGMYMLVTSRKQITSVDLYATAKLAITEKNAWPMLQRLREAWRDQESPLYDIAEKDETYARGKQRNKYAGKKVKGRGAGGKVAFKFWDFPAEASVRETPPCFIPHADKAELESWFQAGTDAPAADGDQMRLILGLDFGTSSTKLIVRQPYERGQPTFAIPAPAFCRSGNETCLWMTVLWLRKDGSFSPWPEAGADVLRSLKQGLIQGRSETVIAGSEAAAAFAVSRAQAGVAYLSFVIRYARGWLLRNRPEAFRGRKPVWFVNLGMPAASYDDPKLAEPYRRVGAAALQLANDGGPITAEATQNFLNKRDVMKAGASREAAEALGVAVYPEAAAEMTGFARSPQNPLGLYLLVDVGAMTLDVCMFRVTNRRDEDGTTGDHYLHMASQIRPLGVDSFHWFLAEGKTEPEFVQQCKRALHDVVWRTKTTRDPHAAVWKRGNTVPVFLTGGGAANQLHRNILNFLDQGLRRAVNGGIRRLKLPVPRNIDLPESLEDLDRMAVAWGLSYPDIGEIHPESSIDDIPPRRIRETPDFISKDQV